MSLLGRSATESRAQTELRPNQEATAEAPETDSTSFKLARVLFGGVLAFMGANNFRDLERYTQYAESKGAPMAETTVPLISGSLLFGGLGVALWKLPRLAAGAITTFLATTTPVMHDFWAIDDEQQREQELFHFLKNAALLGAALAFLRAAEEDRTR